MVGSMSRNHFKAILAIGIALALGVEAGAQRAPTRRIGLGLDLAGSVRGTTSPGTYIGPTIGIELASAGPLRMRADATLQFELGSDPFVNPNVADGGIAPITHDGRLMRALGTATLGIEAGTRERIRSGGLFVAARAGGGVGRWSPGTVDYRMSPTWVFSYSEPGYTAAVLTAGAEVGVWIPMSGRPNRLAVRVDGLHRQEFTRARLAIVVLRHW